MMTAYNHTIDFVSGLGSVENRADIFSDIITIKEVPFFDISRELGHKIKFTNNQGRNLSLYGRMENSFQVEKGKHWAFEIEDVVSFYWESDTKNLGYIPYEKFTEKLLEYWALHIVLPIFFTIEETYDFLHAGAVEVDGKPILFAAESFGGKSTMTDYFLKQGHAMVSDDKVACYEGNSMFFSVPSIPYHRPYRKMEDLGYFVDNRAKVPKPIHAIYELDRAEPDAPVRITELLGIEKFKLLRYSSEINLSFLKEKRFAFLSRMAKVVPVYKVTVPWDVERLREVYTAIFEHRKTG